MQPEIEYIREADRPVSRKEILDAIDYRPPNAIDVSIKRAIATNKIQRLGTGMYAHPKYKDPITIKEGEEKCTIPQHGYEGIGYLIYVAGYVNNNRNAQEFLSTLWDYIFDSIMEDEPEADKIELAKIIAKHTYKFVKANPTTNDTYKDVLDQYRMRFKWEGEW